MKIGKILLKIITVAVACVLLMSIVLADAKNISDLKDVRQDKWYFEAIEYVFDNGFMAGTSQSAFSPDSGVTRAMVVQTFYAIAGKPESSAENKFSDVKSNSWYSSSVNWANANGLAAGYPNGTFRPDVKVTREQLAVFFKAFSGYQKKNNINRAPIYDYTDYDNVSLYALSPMEWAVAVKLISGRSKTELKPKDTATRAELAQMLYRYVPVTRFSYPTETITIDMESFPLINMDEGDICCLEDDLISELNNDDVQWESTSRQYADVNNGVITAKHIGTTYISVREKETGFSKLICAVRVNGFADAGEAYKELNAFRTQGAVWYWNEDNNTKTIFNTGNSVKLNALSRNSALEETAKRRARELTVSASHTRPNGSDAKTAFPKGIVSYGENIAFGSPGFVDDPGMESAKFVTELWKETNRDYSGQGHRRNMLRPVYDSVGIACYYYDGAYFWVQDFGKMN